MDGKDFLGRDRDAQVELCRSIAAEHDLAWVDGPESGFWFRRDADQAVFRLITPRLPNLESAAEEAARLVESRLVEDGVALDVINNLGLAVLFPAVPRESSTIFLAATRVATWAGLGKYGIRRREDQELFDLSDHADGNTAVVTLAQARKACRAGFPLIADAEWVAMAMHLDGLSWWSDQPWNAPPEHPAPLEFVSSWGIRDLGVGEYVAEGAHGGPSAVRGGGGLTFPWQHSFEWIQTVTRIRIPLKRAIPHAGLREVIRI